MQKISYVEQYLSIFIYILERKTGNEKAFSFHKMILVCCLFYDKEELQRNDKRVKLMCIFN